MYGTNYWINGDLEQKRLVQSLMFSDLIEYSKESGFGTANLAFPFKMLAMKNKDKRNLVEAGGFEPPSVSSRPRDLHV